MAAIIKVYDGKDMLIPAELLEEMGIKPGEPVQIGPARVISELVAAYETGEVSLGKAAETLGISQEEMKGVIRASGGQLHLGPQTADEASQDAENARHASR